MSEQRTAINPWVYWSSAAAVTRWAPDDDVRSMPIDRFTRYGYQGGKLGRRRRRERTAIVARITEDRP